MVMTDKIPELLFKELEKDEVAVIFWRYQKLSAERIQIKLSISDTKYYSLQRAAYGKLQISEEADGRKLSKEERWKEVKRRYGSILAGLTEKDIDEWEPKRSNEGIPQESPPSPPPPPGPQQQNKGKGSSKPVRLISVDQLLPWIISAFIFGCILLIGGLVAGYYIRPALSNIPYIAGLTPQVQPSKAEVFQTDEVAKEITSEVTRIVEVVPSTHTPYPTYTLLPTVTLIPKTVTPTITIEPSVTPTPLPTPLIVGETFSDDRVSLKLVSASLNESFWVDNGGTTAAIIFNFRFTNNTSKNILLRFQHSDFTMKDNKGRSYPQSEVWFKDSGLVTVSENINVGQSYDFTIGFGQAGDFPRDVRNVIVTVYDFSSLAYASWIVEIPE
jgi:hypothetical protein